MIKFTIAAFMLVSLQSFGQDLIRFGKSKAPALMVVTGGVIYPKNTLIFKLNDTTTITIYVNRIDSAKLNDKAIPPPYNPSAHK